MLDTAVAAFFDSAIEGTAIIAFIISVVAFLSQVLFNNPVAAFFGRHAFEIHIFGGILVGTLAPGPGFPVSHFFALDFDRAAFFASDNLNRPARLPFVFFNRAVFLFIVGLSRSHCGLYS